MRHFSFHLRTPAGCERDEIGLDLIGIEAAHLEAIQAVPNVADAFQREGAGPLLRDTVEIRDTQDRLLLDVPFWEGLERRPRPCSAPRPRSPSDQL
ncbi:DUF6894 family protein [Methylobacterium sp. JK268]